MKCPYINPTPDQCFNCPFPDCINDELSIEEYKMDVAKEKEPREVLMARIRANRYVARHREEVRKRRLEYYYQHREEEIKKQVEYQKENKERTAAVRKARYHRDIELSRKKQREYRARKRLEKQEREKVR